MSSPWGSTLIQALSSTTLPEARPLSGAAAVAGPEAALAAEFIEYAAVRWKDSVLAPEVPLRDGVADLLRVQLRSRDVEGALASAMPLAELDDRLLFKLASFRPNQPYLIHKLVDSPSDERMIVDLAKGGWVELDKRTLMRHPQLVDDIVSVTSYEFKIRDNHAGLRQAALRRPAVTKSYLVTNGAPKGAFPKGSEFARLGVGWISLRGRPAHRIAAARSSSPRWARYLILRGIVRGLERQIATH